MIVVAAGIGVLAAGCWVVALVSWIQLFGHRREGVSAGKLVFSGLAAFDPGNFRESARPVQRRLTRAFIGFFVCVFAGVAWAAIASS